MLQLIHSSLIQLGKLHMYAPLLAYALKFATTVQLTIGFKTSFKMSLY